jgi:hypothetical protein
MSMEDPAGKFAERIGARRRLRAGEMGFIEIE